MKKTAISNIYENTLNETWELFNAHLQGSHTALVCVLSEQVLDTSCRSALNSSAEALGYGRDGCCFATLTDSDNTLDEQTLFLLIEGLDPLCLIAADAVSARTLGKAYRTKVIPEKQNRVFGRTCVAFNSFSAMLADNHKKQVAWALLKQLPRFNMQ